MKKKTREITVDGKIYIWMVGRGGYLQVFFNRKEIIYQEFRSKITPGIVAEAIKVYNYQQKNIEFKKELLTEKIK